MTDQDGAGDGNAHQCVDVQIEVLERDPALFIGAKTAAEDGHQRNDRDHPIRRGRGEVDDFRQQCTHTGQRQWPPVFPVGFRCRCFSPLLQRFGVHAQGLDRLDDGLGAWQIVGHAEHPVDQIELQLLHACQLA
ncbi:hypothetical protein D9M73_192020 [compost metagenome]